MVARERVPYIFIRYLFADLSSCPAVANGKIDSRHLEQRLQVERVYGMRFSKLDDCLSVPLLARQASAKKIMQCGFVFFSIRRVEQRAHPVLYRGLQAFTLIT